MIHVRSLIPCRCALLMWMMGISITGCHVQPSTGLQETILFKSGQGSYSNYRIPSLIVSPRGTILAFCEGRQTPAGPGNDTGEINILLRRSLDNGKTFEKPQVVWADGKNTCGNPCAVVDRTTGIIHLLLTHNLRQDHEKDIIAGKSVGSRTVWITSSNDDGITWQPPREITTDVKKPDWAWYATGPGIGIQIESGSHAGRLVIPCDHVSLAAKEANSHVIFSDDHGATWKIGGEPPEKKFNESQIVELSAGRIMLNMRNYGRGRKTTPSHRGTSVSTDGGELFSSAQYDPALIEPVCQASIFRYTSKDITKPYILFANPASESQRIKLTISLSYDDASTWPISREIYSGKTGYSSIAQLSDNSIGLLYEAGDDKPYQRIVFAKFPLNWLNSPATSPK